MIPLSTAVIFSIAFTSLEFCNIISFALAARSICGTPFNPVSKAADSLEIIPALDTLNNCGTLERSPPTTAPEASAPAENPKFLIILSKKKFAVNMLFLSYQLASLSSEP